MLSLLKPSLIVLATTWIFFFVVAFFACRNGSESDMSSLDSEVLEGIQKPVLYWTNRIAFVAKMGDTVARISFLDIVVRPQECGSPNESLSLGKDDVRIEVGENREKGYKIRPAICPPPAVSRWCAASWFGMRSVFFRLNRSQNVYPKNVTASYCCLETHPVGRVIVQLRDNFEIFTLCGIVLFILINSFQYLWIRFAWPYISARHNRRSGANARQSEMDRLENDMGSQ